MADSLGSGISISYETAEAVYVNCAGLVFREEKSICEEHRAFATRRNWWHYRK